MDADFRSYRLDQFIVGTKWILGLIIALALVTFVVTLGTIADGRKQTLDAIQDLRKQIDLLKQENHWSMQDRADLHETQGAIREALKRMEGKRP